LAIAVFSEYVINEGVSHSLYRAYRHEKHAHWRRFSDEAGTRILMPLQMPKMAFAGIGGHRKGVAKGRAVRYPFLWVLPIKPACFCDDLQRFAKHSKFRLSL
jgi:hypothetical protein